jgi:hypothetical protein
MNKLTIIFVLALSALSLSFIACNSTKSNKGTKTDNMQEDYHQLSKTDKLSNFEGKKVQFEGKISTIIMQHMMKGSNPFLEEGEEQEEHKYILPPDDYAFHEIVAYYFPNKVTWPDAEKLRFYGTIQMISGAGKGGGTHTEYYIDLDKVEAVK